MTVRLAPLGKLFALSLAVALTGCGGGGTSTVTTQRAGTAGSEARDVVVRYFHEVVADRSEQACATFLTKRGVHDIYGQESCSGVTDVVPGPVRVESAEQKGDTTRVVVYLSPGTRDKRIVSLRREGGVLKIDAVEQP